jgi:hypothetical protein
MTTYVLASASDGYQVLFSLAELDRTGSQKRSNGANEENGNRTLMVSFPLPPFSPLLRF